MSFRYDKDNLYKEFQVATTKDTKGKKEKYNNRIQFFTEICYFSMLLFFDVSILTLKLQVKMQQR